MAAGGDGMKPHESPYKKNKRIKMTSGQSFVQTQIGNAALQGQWVQTTEDWGSDV
jgi:hypothetical protein